MSSAAKKWANAGEKVCSRCGQTKPLSAFTVRQSGPREGCPVSYCKPCAVKRQSANYNNDTYQRVTRPWQLKNKYGITSEDYDRMLADQGGKCKICGSKDPKTPRGYVTFAIDHCHETGRVRGLLCNPCNRALGLFKDSPDILTKARHYLNVR